MNKPYDPVPLFVDLDGTVIKTDLLVESALSLLKRAPWTLFTMMIWLIRGGRSGLKAEIARRVELDASLLPLQTEFVAFLRQEAHSGRAIYLATASDERLAQPVARRLGFFRAVLASTPGHNLKSKRKLDAILEMADGHAFDYAGNAHADMAVWAKARRVFVVNPDPGVAAAARARFSIDKLFDDRPGLMVTWLRAVRIHQWLKNLLILVPLLTAHVYSFASIGSAGLGFVAFGCVASGTYLLNDLLDLAADRRHPRKSRRPFAAGELNPGLGLAAMLILVAAGLAIAAAVSAPFLLSVLAYLLLTLSYSLYFKTYVLLDVIVLAGLYTVRIFAGALAIEVPVSSWLLLFSTFVFLSLALVKRCSELEAMHAQARTSASGRDYRVSDRAALGAMGVAAGYISILILALYVDDPAVRARYGQPYMLWALCPFMLYWISRLWIKTARGEMHDDPLIYSLRDKASWIMVLAMGLTTLLAI